MHVGIVNTLISVNGYSGTHRGVNEVHTPYLICDFHQVIKPYCSLAYNVQIWTSTPLTYDQFFHLSSYIISTSCKKHYSSLVNNQSQT